MPSLVFSLGVGSWMGGWEDGVEEDGGILILMRCLGGWESL